MFLRLAAMLVFGMAAHAADRPNIVFMLADDLGYGDLESFGAKDIKTPYIDSIARGGVRFTRAYSNGAECTPARTAILTGRYPQRAGGMECPIGTGNVGRYDEAIRLRERNDLGLPPRMAVLTPGHILRVSRWTSRNLRHRRRSLSFNTAVTCTSTVQSLTMYLLQLTIRQAIFCMRRSQ